MNETSERLITNKGALSRLLSQEEFDKIFDTSNDILNTALYLKQHATVIDNPDVLQYIINMNQH
jgi:hypothetical protein